MLLLCALPSVMLPGPLSHYHHEIGRSVADVDSIGRSNEQLQVLTGFQHESGVGGWGYQCLAVGQSITEGLRLEVFCTG